MTYYPAIPANASKASTQQRAVEYARAKNFRIGDPIEDLVAELGGRIHYRTFFGEGAMESIVIHERGDFDIFLPDHTSYVRDRFSLLHEIAHYLIHYPKVIERHVGAAIGMFANRAIKTTDTAERRNDPEWQAANRAEWEANWFAGAFLMPAEEFRFECERDSDLDAIAQRFRVSRRAVEVRKSDLHIS